MIAALQQTVENDIERGGAAVGQDDILGTFRTEERGGMLAAVKNRLRRAERQPVTAPSRVGAIALQRLRDRPNDRRRLGKGGGAVVKINQTASSAKMPL